MKSCPECYAKNLNSNKECDVCGASLEGVSIQDSSTDNPDQSELLNIIKTMRDRIEAIEINTRKKESVAISDVNMSFGSMVIFMIKWAIAAIPAAIILFFLISLITTIFGGMLAAFLR